MMKPFELFYLCMQPFYLPLHRKVRHLILNIVKSKPSPCELLDVGGRKSHYTIGVPANITISDLPREAEVQHQLNLGINTRVIDVTKSRRTNVRNMVFDDMTRSSLPSESFDCVVSVEVLEHVEEDYLFVKEVQRVLKRGGVFLMTTPNGNYVENRNPDHKRHYKLEQLRELLSSYFDDVEVEFAIKGGTFRRWGLKSWSVRRPKDTLLSMFGNLMNSLQSSGSSIKKQAIGTHHLIARARKLH